MTYYPQKPYQEPRPIPRIDHPLLHFEHPQVSITQAYPKRTNMSAVGSSSKQMPAPIKLKVKVPTPFDGKRKELGQFTTQLELYFRFNQEYFPDDEKKVLFASTYLQGAAYDWFEGKLRDFLDETPEDRNESTDRVFASYKTFKDQLFQTFGEIDKERTAEQQLQMLCQTGSAADYSAKFQQYSAQTEWDEAALTARFYQGLKDRIKDDIARGERPARLELMISTAVRIDNRQYEREMERKGTYRFPARIGSKTNNKPRGGYQQPYYGPMPMELDGTQPRNDRKHGGKSQNTKKTFSCYNCGKPGHYAKDCRQPKQHVNATRSSHLGRRTVNAMERIHVDELDDYLADDSSISSFELVSCAQQPADKIPDSQDWDTTPETLARGSTTWYLPPNLEEYLEQQTKQQEQEDQEKQARMQHASLSWTGCYDDNCVVHRSEKDGAGWYPTAPKKRKTTASQKEKPRRHRNVCGALRWMYCYNINCKDHCKSKAMARWYPMEPTTRCDTPWWNVCKNHGCETHLLEKRERRFFPGGDDYERRNRTKEQTVDNCFEDSWQFCFAPLCEEHLASKRLAGHVPKNF